MHVCPCMQPPTPLRVLHPHYARSMSKEGIQKRSTMTHSNLHYSIVAWRLNSRELLDGRGSGCVMWCKTGQQPSSDALTPPHWSPLPRPPKKESNSRSLTSFLKKNGGQIANKQLLHEPQQPVEIHFSGAQCLESACYECPLLRGGPGGRPTPLEPMQSYL
mmetsp:Transcript_104183/g.179522  ORF Transcript_104183/g.179522 Transcript_104183/m.179522 type:complete len:161 (-) Transcript_104183:308-790(-)